MRRCAPLLFADPSLIVQRRLPWQMRKYELKQQLWAEEEEDEESASESALGEATVVRRTWRRGRGVGSILKDSPVSAEAKGWVGEGI